MKFKIGDDVRAIHSGLEGIVQEIYGDREYNIKVYLTSVPNWVVFKEDQIELVTKTYSGEKMIKLIKGGNFKEGDLIIGYQEDFNKDILESTYEYIKVNDYYEFVDTDCSDSVLDAFDLVYCTFEIVDMVKHREEKIENLKKERVSMLEEVKLIEKEIRELSNKSLDESLDKCGWYFNELGK